jgi:hypothetical protein
MRAPICPGRARVFKALAARSPRVLDCFTWTVDRERRGEKEDLVRGQRGETSQGALQPAGLDGGQRGGSSQRSRWPWSGLHPSCSKRVRLSRKWLTLEGG